MNVCKVWADKIVYIFLRLIWHLWKHLSSAFRAIHSCLHYPDLSVTLVHIQHLFCLLLFVVVLDVLV